VQVRAFLGACERCERDQMAVQLALILTATRGDNQAIKNLLREIQS